MNDKRSIAEKGFLKFMCPVYPINLMELRGSSATGGGPDKTILLSAERHNKNLINPIVVYLRDVTDSKFKIKEAASGRGFEFIEVPDKGKLDVRCILKLNQIIRSYNIKIIHGHDYKTDFLAFVLKLINPSVKLVSTAHGWIATKRKGKFYKWIHLKILGRIENLIAVSRATKKIMVESGIKSDRIKVLYNAIDEEAWKKKEPRESLREEWDIPDDSIVIGTVGRISDEKNFKGFLDIARKVKGQSSGVYFVLVGEGRQGQKTELISYAKKIGVEGCTLFAGYRSDLLKVYSSFDIFLMTSNTEGLPNSVLEAMSMEIPVVSTKAGGVPEMIEDKKSGFLADIGDMDKLSEFVVELVENKQLRREIGRAGREEIKKSFSFKVRLKTIEEYYVDLLKNQRIPKT